MTEIETIHVYKPAVPALDAKAPAVDAQVIDELEENRRIIAFLEQTIIEKQDMYKKEIEEL